MDHDDAVGRRVYGTDHGDPHPYPRPGRTYRELLGGPLDGQLLDVTDRMPEELFTGALLIAPLGMYGPGGRADYGSREDDPFGPWSGAVTPPDPGPVLAEGRARSSGGCRTPAVTLSP